MKNVAIIILIAILVLVSFLLFVKVNLDYEQIKRLKEEQADRDLKYLENLSKATEKINELQDENDSLKEVADEIKASENLIQENYQMFEVTAYTSQECGTVTKIGIDLKSTYAKYLNVCAVDPDVIALGSMVLIKFADGTEKPYLACDTGSAIKGKIIDIYMTDVSKALEFGRQVLLIKIIK